MSASWAVNRNSKISNAASIEYVDEKDELKEEIEKKADKEDLEKAIDDIEYTRKKTDDIYKILIEMND
jgi:hypothetical protein